MRFLAAALVISSCLAVSPDRAGDETSVRHVTVINVLTGAEIQDQTVRIQGNRIVSIAPTVEADAALPNSLDARGEYLIPGLWDMHVHVHDTKELPLYLANGVTGIRIMSGERDEAAARRELAQQSPAPEIYLASAIVDGDPPVWPGSIVVKKPADARRTVDEIKAAGADFIKVYNRIPRDAYFAIVEEAKAQHIDFEGHVPDAITAQEASAAGQRSIEHLTGIPLACSKRQEALMGDMQRAPFYRDRLMVEAEAYRSFDPEKCQALLGEFRKNETWQVPTLVLERVYAHLDDSHFLSDPRLAYIDRKSRSRWEDRLQIPIHRWNNGMYEMTRGLFSADEKIVGNMFREGVPLMAGTDAMNPYCFPGFSLHDELALLVDSGLTPLAALQAATLNPAKFMGKTGDFGTVDAGKIANLVLLRADPLADIHNSTQIDGVWLDGKYFSPGDLKQLLDNVKRSARH